jgi:hypothetical protein
MGSERPHVRGPDSACQRDVGVYGHNPSLLAHPLRSFALVFSNKQRSSKNLKTKQKNTSSYRAFRRLLRARANSEYFIVTLRKASGVWILGGWQWRHADAYLDTAVEREIKALLARGGVGFGSSAETTILGSFLVSTRRQINSELAGVFVNLVASLFSRRNFYLIRFVAMASAIFVTYFSIGADAKDSNVTSHVQLLVLRVI